LSFLSVNFTNTYAYNGLTERQELQIELKAKDFVNKINSEKKAKQILNKLYSLTKVSDPKLRYFILILKSKLNKKIKELEKLNEEKQKVEAVQEIIEAKKISLKDKKT
jgi:hypothetical protein